MHYLLQATHALIAFWGVRFPMLSEGECWFLAMLTVLVPVYVLNVLVYRPRRRPVRV